MYIHGRFEKNTNLCMNTMMTKRLSNIWLYILSSIKMSLNDLITFVGGKMLFADGIDTHRSNWIGPISLCRMVKSAWMRIEQQQWRWWWWCFWSLIILCKRPLNPLVYNVHHFPIVFLKWWINKSLGNFSSENFTFY